jgi:iron complex outermembrane receptor protein
LRPHDTRAAISVTGGSYGSHAGSVYGSVGTAGRGVLVAATFAGAENDYEFTDSAGHTQRWQNADATLVDLWLLGRTEVGRGSVEVTLNHFRREQGAVRLATVQTYESRQSLDRTLGAVTGRAQLGSRTWLELRTSALIASSTLDDPKQELLPAFGAPGTRLEQRGERIEEELAARIELGTQTRLRVALLAASERLRRFENAQVPDVPAVLDVERASGRLAGAVERDLNGWLSLRALLALDCHATSTGAPFESCDSLAPVGRLGADLRAGELSGFLAAGRYVRAPTLAELYGTSLVVQGNPTLADESGATLDAGVRFAHALAHQARPLYAALSGYFRRSTNLITSELTEQGYVRPANVNVADVLGLELEAGSGFARYFAADLALTLLDFRDRTPERVIVNDILPYHSRLVVAPGLAAMSPELHARWLNRATLGARLLYQSNRYADFAGLGVIPEQASLDLDAALQGFEGKVWLRGRVTDVLDTPRYDVVGFPLPGRSFFVSLELNTGAL